MAQPSEPPTQPVAGRCAVSKQSEPSPTTRQVPQGPRYAVARHGFPPTVPDPNVPVSRAGGVSPGRSQASKVGSPPGSWRGMAVAIAPLREYAVTLSTGTEAGSANATNRDPSTSAGCRVRVVPSDSSTRAETTSFHTRPKLMLTESAPSPPPSPSKLIGTAAVGCRPGSALHA